MTAWHERSTEDVLDELGSDRDAGLVVADAERRRAEYGPNELVESGGRTPWEIVWEQVSSPMIVLLAVAALVSAFLHEVTDAVAIVAIIALNAALGFFQDYRAERALAALKHFAVPTVKVRREAALRELPSTELVPGDVVQLETGSLVPADVRLLACANLKIEEASLTGESEAVTKTTDAIGGGDVPLGDRRNMAYLGTLITFGHGWGVVTATGMQTELGRIAHSLQTVKPEPTPLQRRLGQLGRTLAFVALAIVAAVFGLGIVAGEDPLLMLRTALSLAVAVVPEGLPAVATVALAVGARRMFARNALIRKLPAVETLGSVTVICSDKTGTLTENRMTVTVFEIPEHRIDVAADVESPYELHDDETAARRSSVALLLTGAALCNDAELDSRADSDVPQAFGEPTESALLVAAARFRVTGTELTDRFPRVDEVPFDSSRKRMTTVHRVEPVDAEPVVPLAHLGDGEHVAFMKGAVSAVLDACDSVWTGERIEPLDEDERGRIVAANDALASRGMRVLSVAFRPLTELPPSGDESAIETGMCIVGLLGIIDPPRPEVHEAVARCRRAGIRPMMITGDHPLTALHIARQLGITEGDRTLTGPELAGRSPTELRAVTEEVSVYARVAPTDKLHIVQALQESGHVVAMTGDGVNDAPALKQAHIGVAMGEIGTDVSKEASDMVLLDDNFATIVNAVEQGRIVYDNIRKFVRYTMTSNAGEVCVMVLGPLVGMPLPLMPLQILWVNLVTDGLPGLALAVEPAERETMNRPPYPPGEHVMGRGMWRDIAWIGLLMGAVSLAFGFWQWKYVGVEEARWRTVVFTVLTLSQMGNALAVRSRDSLFRIGLLSNKAMLGAVLLTFVLQLAVVYVPVLQTVFGTVPLTIWELCGCLLLSTVVFWSIEAVKCLARRSATADSPTA